MIGPSTRLPVLPDNQTFSTCVGQLKVLADTTRFAVIQVLLGGPSHVLELAHRLRVEQSLLSHHLRVLRDARLVVSTRTGKNVLYRVSVDVERSFTEADAIDLGCCQLSFGGPAAPHPSRSPARTPSSSGARRPRRLQRR